MPTKTDVIVIGGGPGGYVAAIRSAQLGLSVTLHTEKCVICRMKAYNRGFCQNLDPCFLKD